MNRTFDLQQSQRREDNVRTERAYEIATNGNTRASEVTYLTRPQNGTAMETQSMVYDTVQGTNTQSSYSTIPNVESTSPQEFHRESACNDPHRVYHILTNENEPTNRGTLLEGPPSNQPELETGSAELRVLLTHAPVYETIDKPESQKDTALPGQPVYSTLEAPKYSLVNKKSKSTSAVEGLPKKAAGKTGTVHKNTTEALDMSTAGGRGGNGHSDTGATVPEETEVSQGTRGGTEFHGEGDPQSKHRKVSAVERSTKKLPNYDVVTKQDLTTAALAGDAIYSSLDHTKPQSQKTSHENEDTYNTLQHTKNSQLAHSVSDSRGIPPMVAYETIDGPREAKTMALPGQPVYSTLGTPKYSLANKKSKSTSDAEGLRREATTELHDSSATGSSTAGREKVGQNSPSGMGNTLVPSKVPLFKEVQYKDNPLGEMCLPPQPPDHPPKPTIN